MLALFFLSRRAKVAELSLPQRMEQLAEMLEHRANPQAGAWITLLESLPGTTPEWRAIQMRITLAWRDASRGYFGAAADMLKLASRDLRRFPEISR